MRFMLHWPMDMLRKPISCKYKRGAMAVRLLRRCENSSLFGRIFGGPAMQIAAAAKAESLSS